MPAWRLLPLLALVSTGIGCAAFNYPSEDTDDSAAGAPEAPILLEVGSGEDAVEVASLAAAGERAPRTWYELTRAARLARQAGDFEEARERLAQAALQLDGRPPSDAARRAVHGMRARLALDFVALQREAEAEALADLLFEEARSEPEIGGPATVDLVEYFAGKRAAKARESGLDVSALPLLRIALDSAAHDSASVQRLELAYDVSQTAIREGDDALARRAIELALADARTVQSSDKVQIASLEIYRARIARSQGDLATAERAATIANQLFDEVGSPPATRAIGESTLAAIVAERGDSARARAIIQGARARLDQSPPLPEHAVRTVLAEAGRIERSLGDAEAARALFSQALEIPGLDFPADEALVESLARELAALDENANGALEEDANGAAGE
ncbi:unnamed protein product, partial [Discosporangium mesarthrocarpum]